MSSPTTALYRVRPGSLVDVPAAGRLFCAAFARDSLFDILYPTRRHHPAAFQAHLIRFFRTRYWTPGYSLHVLVDDADPTARPLAFSWWRRPLDQLSFYERWLSPYAWFAPLMRAALRLHNALSPLPPLEEHVDVFQRVLAGLEPDLLDSPRRRAAWYLSTLAVEPALQGRGLGSVLLADGMARTRDSGDQAAWLVGVAGTDGFYGRHGFVEVARANVGELAHWDGGLVMFAE